MSRNVPIIVGGCHRSGTSLIRRILNSHSRIFCGPEVKFFLDFYSDYFHDPLHIVRFSTTVRSLVPESEALEIMGRSYIAILERATARSDKRRWADKNPENVLFLDAWQQLLGDDWIFLHVVRNPLDTLASLKEAKFELVVEDDLSSQIALYKKYTEAGLRFGAKHPEKYRRIVYDELVADPAGVLRALMAQLNEEFEPAQLAINSAHHASGLEDPKIASTQSIHNQSHNSWQRRLTTQEADHIMLECGSLWNEIIAVPTI